MPRSWPCCGFFSATLTLFLATAHLACFVMLVHHGVSIEREILSTNHHWRSLKHMLAKHAVAIALLLLAAITGLSSVSHKFAIVLTSQKTISTLSLATMFAIVATGIARVLPTATLVDSYLYGEGALLSALEGRAASSGSSPSLPPLAPSETLMPPPSADDIGTFATSWTFNTTAGKVVPLFYWCEQAAGASSSLCETVVEHAAICSLAVAPLILVLCAVLCCCSHRRSRCLLLLALRVLSVAWAIAGLSLGSVALPLAAVLLVPIGLTKMLSLFSVQFSLSSLLHMLCGVPWVDLNSTTLRAVPLEPEAAPVAPAAPPQLQRRLRRLLPRLQVRLGNQPGRGQPLGVAVVTVPVYSENFERTIKPTLREVMKLAARYGGKVLPLVCDDGMHGKRKGKPLCTREQQEERRRFYEELGLAWVARPAEGRAGKFKKSSNLNTALTFALGFLSALVSTRDSRAALNTARGQPYFARIEISVPPSLLRTFEHGISQGELDAWFNLQLDTDTRVPPEEDALGHFAREFKHDPKAGVLQCAMKGFVDDPATATAFQKMQLHWTNGLYNEAILLACAGGCPAPLVGHNVAIRGAAMLEVANKQPAAAFGGLQFWSEAHTGEDFVMMMKIMKGSFPHVAYLTYLHGFAEGVDESVHVNWTNYKKYVNSTMEMVFNPPALWFASPRTCKEGERPGLFTPLIKEFLFETPACPWEAKVATLAYLGTHFAFALGLPLAWATVVWLRVYAVRRYLLSSLDIYCSVLVVFPLFGALAAQITKRRHLPHTRIGPHLVKINEEATGQRWRMGGGWPNLLQLWIELVVYGTMKLFLFGGLPIHTTFIVVAFLFQRAPEYGASRDSNDTTVPRNALEAASFVVFGKPTGETVARVAEPSTRLSRVVRRIVCGRRWEAVGAPPETVAVLEGGYATQYAVLLASSLLHALLTGAGIVPLAWEVLPLVSFHLFGLAAPLVLDETVRSNTRLWLDASYEKLTALEGRVDQLQSTSIERMELGEIGKGDSPPPRPAGSSASLALERVPAATAAAESQQAPEARAQAALGVGGGDGTSDLLGASQKTAAAQALQALMAEGDQDALRIALEDAEGLAMLPPEALRVARERLALLDGNSGGSGGLGADGLAVPLSPMAADTPLQAELQRLMGELRQKMDLTQQLQATLARLQADADGLAAENRRLRAEASARGCAGGDGGSDDVNAQVLQAYQQAREAIMATLEKGVAPSPQLYAERDVHMYCLSDADLQGEYAHYTRLYLADDTPPKTRGMAEMTLMRLGELVDKPQHERAKLIERQAEEQRLAREERLRERERTEAEVRERQAQQAMNRLAFDTWAPLWRALVVHPPARVAEADGLRVLAKRLQKRAELRLAVLEADILRKMPPGNFTAMGTSGLSAGEMRAIHHALEAASVTAKPALKFVAMLQDKIRLLPPYEAEAVPQLQLLPEEAEEEGEAPPTKPQVGGPGESGLAAATSDAAANGDVPSSSSSGPPKPPPAPPAPPAPPPPPPPAPPDFLAELKSLEYGARASAAGGLC